MRLILLDLDQTLTDSSSTETLRKSRSWNQVYEQIKYYRFSSELIHRLNYLRAKNLIRIGIITNSPRPYALRVIQFLELNIDYLIAYHDVIHKKPSPEGILKAIQIAKNEFQTLDPIYIGDHPDDYQAAKGANIKFFKLTDFADPKLDQLFVGNFEKGDYKRLIEYIGFI